MNAVRERVLEQVKPYMDFAEHKDLIAFTLGESYFNYDYENDVELESDFCEIGIVVEKDWLFELMKEEDIENPREYLQNEYTWDDSFEWFYKANEENKIVMVNFY